MRDAYNRRPEDFKRRIIKTNIYPRSEMYIVEQYYLNMIDKSEIKPVNAKPKYYNLSLSSKNPWHKYQEHIKSVGEKISEAKKGKKTGPRDPSIGQKISEAKRQKRLERETAGLPAYNVSEKVRAANLAKTGRSHTDEQKKKISESVKSHYTKNPKQKAEPVVRMSIEEQSKLCSEQLTMRWADPVWKENQVNRLKESWVKRREKLNTDELTH
jgi:hypothetical protein